MKKRIPLGECALLCREDARRYVGCLGDETFDREIMPHVTPRRVGLRTYYRRRELDAWIEGTHIKGENPFKRAALDAYAESSGRSQENR